MSDDLPPSSSTSIDVRFVVERGVREPARELPRGWRQHLAATARALWDTEQHGRKATVGIVLVDADRIRTLNRTFRGIDRPTDVLSFDLADHPEAVEGELYIALDVARKQAGQRGLPLVGELARLTIHGLLHLAGYDHHRSAEGRRMAGATRRWLDHWEQRSTRNRVRA